MDTDDHEHFKTIAAVSSKPLTGSLKKPNEESSSSRLDQAYLLGRARILFACYRRDEAADPETYCAAVAAVLGDGYSREVVEFVTDPRTGLPSKQKFLPNIAEIRETLDARMDQIHRVRTYEQRVEEQLRLRDEWKAQVPSERLKAAGRAWLDREDPKARELSGQKPRKAYSEEEKAAFLESAKQAGRAVSSMTLLEETRELSLNKAL